VEKKKRSEKYAESCMSPRNEDGGPREAWALKQEKKKKRREAYGESYVSPRFEDGGPDGHGPKGHPREPRVLNQEKKKKRREMYGTVSPGVGDRKRKKYMGDDMDRRSLDMHSAESYMSPQFVDGGLGGHGQEGYPRQARA